MNVFKLKKWDFILIGIITVVSVGIFLGFYLRLRPGKTVKVSVNNETKYTLSLEKDCTKEIITEKGSNTVKIKDGRVTVESADCPDKICVNHRPISKTGETIVCLPHRLTVEIEGGKE